ncbi:helix-turn-helix domain-containing protein [Muribaculum intestinale]|uniref:helix-turn-helix domain-containing protein n=1 Tax=Muribaculum intestinale TaxID=1796646 RepID=UPI0025B68C83|nr:helix-turn-helix domain-containing protein [Muribaculum intestinale]
MTDAQLSEKLNISRRTLQEYRDNRQIAYYRLDGKILYADDDVEEFLKSTYRPKY